MINPFLIMKEVEHSFFLKEGSLVAHNRKPIVSIARAVAMHIIRNNSPLSYPEIGEYFECHHSTVIYNCKRIVNMVHENKNKYILNVIINIDNEIRELVNE